MRQITSLLLMLLFVSSTMLYGQQQGDFDQIKMDLMNQPQVELAPGTYPGDATIASDADYDLQFEYPVGVGEGEAGIETDGTYIYTTKWNGVDFYRYETDGTYLESFTIAGAGEVRDLAFDGTYFYGGAAATTVFEMDFDTETLISTFTAPTAVRAIGYDEVEDGFWANNWSTTLTLFDRSGATLNTIATNGDESFYGLAYDPQGPYLWGYSQRTGSSQNILYKYELPTGTFLEEFDVLPLLTLPVTGDIAGGLAFHPDIVPGTYTIMGLVQNVCLWGLEMGITQQFTNDVAISSIVSPSSGIELTADEPVIIKIKNTGTASQSNIPWEVTWTGQGSGSFSGTLAGPLAEGEEVELNVGTADLSEIGTYNFEACTDLAGDENPGNDCKTKAVTNDEPSLCVDNLYTSGCGIGDQLTSWDLANINVPSIPCAGTPEWYQDYMDLVHELTPGETYELSVTAGYGNTYFAIWVDWDNNLDLTADEMILDDLCTAANTVYTFDFVVPADAPAGEFVMRARTNWQSPATDPCATYSYGNCCDFTVLTGPVQPEPARVQVIHNSADLAAEVVDVWLDDVKLIENFAFRTATPFIDAPTGVEFTIAIQPPGSTSPEDPLWSQDYTLDFDETYLLVASGIVSASGYDPVEPFDIYVFPLAREEATQASNTDLLAFHGSTDAPTVTIWETGVGAGEIIDDFSYGDFAGYLELETLDYVIEVRDETGTVVVASYSAPLASLGLDGAAITAVASGFLDPSNNSNGAEFGIWVALASGGDLIPLPVYPPPSTGNPPENLQAELIGDDSVLLTWDAPMEDGEWYHWDSGTNFDGIGLTDGGVLTVAARWTPDQLGALDGNLVTKVALFPRSDLGATFTLKIYEGVDASTLLVSEDITATLVQEEWNTITLTTPVEIDGTTELWVGYEVEHDIADYPAGTDEGPAVAGFGDMVTFDGGANWDPLSSFGLDYNWNIQIFVTDGSDGAVAQPIAHSPSQQTNVNPQLVAGNLKQAVNNTMNTMRNVLGYNVYRDDDMIAEEISDLEYLDEGLEEGTYDYTVKAVYAGGLSDPAGPVSIYVPGAPTGDPEINFDPTSLTETHNAPGLITTKTLMVSNTGEGTLDFDITIQRSANTPALLDPQTLAELREKRLAKTDLEMANEQAPGTVAGNEVIATDADYDLQFEYPVGVGDGEAGIETDGTYIYTTKWNGADFYRYETDGTYLESFTIAGAGEVRDLAFDGTYFYGGAAATTVFEMDFDTETLISTFTAPTAVRAIGYDEVEDGFWANNWSTTLTLFDRSGATLNTIATNGDESFYGLAYDPQGPYLWGYSQRVGTSQNILYKFELPTGTFLEEFDVLPLLTLPITGDIAGGLAFHPDIVPGTYSVIGLVQNVCFWGLEMGATSTPGDWLTAAPMTGSVEPNESLAITVTFNSNGLEMGNTYNGALDFASNDPASPHSVPATLIVDDQTVGPIIDIDPMSLTETHDDPPQTTSQFITVTNEGDEQLDWSLDIMRSRVTIPQGLDDAAYAEALAQRMTEEGSPVVIGRTAAGGASPNMTDDEVIRYDDGVNNDAIGLTAGGTFNVAAYFPASTMAQYSGMELNQVEVYINDVPNPMVLQIFGQGTSTVPGDLLASQTVTPSAESWIMIDLDTPVDITGEDLWIGYEVTHSEGTFPAGCDAGPAVAGFGDMISLDGSVYEPMSALGLDYNWNIAGYLVEGGPGLPNDVGVQSIVEPTSGVELSASEPVVIKIKNYGTNSQSNIPWEVTWTGAGSGSFSGTLAGPLAEGEEAEVTAGTADLSAYGVYTFEACTDLSGDENAANDCKTKAVENIEPSLCVDNLYSTGCSVGDQLTSWDLANINVPSIPCSGTPEWYQDYMDQVHELQAGQTYELTVTAGYANTFFAVWIDFDGNLDLTMDEMLLSEECVAEATPYTFDLVIPSDVEDGTYVMRARTNWLNPVTDPCETYSYGNCVDFSAEIGGGSPPVDEWLTAMPLSGSLAPGASEQVEVIFNSEGLAVPSVNEGMLVFSSNDPNSPDEVPATLYVGDEPPQDPQIAFDPEELNEVHPEPDQITTQTLMVSNTGGEDLLFDITVQRAARIAIPESPDPETLAQLYAERELQEGGVSADEKAPGTYPGNATIPTDADYDLQFEYPVGVGGGEAGIETDGTYIYTTKWNGADFYRYETDGTYLESFTIAGAGEVRDLAFDGTYFYGGAAATTVFEMDFDTETLISTFTAPTAVRAIGYDEGEDGFWANNWSTTITLFDRSGATLNTIPANGDESFYGFAYDPQGPYLWGYSQRVGSSQNILYKYDLPSGAFLEEFDVLPLLTLPVTGDIAGGLAFHPDIVPGTYTIMGLVQNVCLWGLEMGITQQFTNDVAISSIVSPSSGIELTADEPVIIKIKNTGTASQSNIPWEVTWTGQGSGSFSGTLAGPLAEGEEVELNVGTADLSEFGTYNFEACTDLAGDENPGNDCKTKAVTNDEPSLCVDNLYTSGCGIGDQLTSWDLANINVPSIPCAGTPEWYQDYTDQVHELEAGETYQLTVTAGYNNTFFAVWIDFDGNLDLTMDEMLLSEECAVANSSYTFDLEIPSDVEDGTFVLRARTNWQAPVTDPCETYSYGNCVDFSAQLGGGTGPTEEWLTADPLTGTVAPGESLPVTVTFNSTDLVPGIYEGGLLFDSNDPDSPHTVDATLSITPEGAIIDLDPMSLTETHLTPPQSTTQIVTVTNVGTDPLDWVLAVQRSFANQSERSDKINSETIAQRIPIEGNPFVLGKAAAGGASPNMTDDEVIRYDDGINNDAIGLTAGGTFSVAAYFPASTMAQYSGMELNQVEVYINDVPNPMVLQIFGQGTSTVPGDLLASQTVTPSAESWIMIDLDDPVYITGEDLWIGYEVTHPASTFPAGCDAGPAVAGFGDMISLDGSVYEPMSALGLDYNWNIAGYLVEGTPPADEWLTASPLSGLLNPGESVEVEVTFNSEGLDPGTYDGALIFSSNDPNSPHTVPATLNVGGVEDPEITVTPDELEELHETPDLITEQTVEVGNTGGADLEWTLEVERSMLYKSSSAPVVRGTVPERNAAAAEKAPGTVFGNETIPTDAEYDLQFEYAVGVGGGEAGIETDGTYIYTTKWNGADFYRYQTDGTYLETFTVPGAGEVRDLAFDGTYFYGGAAATTVFEMDFDTETLISSFAAPTAVRAIGYDEGEDGFWANNWSTTLTLFDRSGATLSTIPTNGDESFYGLAYDPQGPYLWGYSQRTGSSQNILYKYALPSGAFLEEFDVFPLLSLPITGDIAGGLAFHPDIVPGTYTIMGIVQNICIWGLEMGFTGNIPWLSADPLAGTVTPGGSEDVTVTFNSTGLEQGTYEGALVFSSNDPANPELTVPVTLIVGGEPPCPFPAPENVTGTEVSPNTVLLEWDEPEIPGGIIRWDDGINNDGIGLTDGGNFQVAAKFTNDQLGEFDGLYLTDVDIFPRSATADFILKVWTGATGTQELLSQPITVVAEEWNTITLDTPIEIDASQDLYIGYETTHDAGDFPAGCDAGPAVEGFGDLIALGGGAWEPMSALGLDYNWNIAGHIGLAADGKQMTDIIQIGQTTSAATSAPVAGNLSKPVNALWMNTVREVLGYDIMRDGESVGTTDELYFYDVDLDPDTYEYKVGAIYDECTSYADAIDVLVTSVSEVATSKVAMYPNPASDVLNIEAGNITQVTIINNLGQVVYNKALEMDNVQINTSNFDKGMYVVRIHTATKVHTEKLIIQ